MAGESLHTTELNNYLDRWRAGDLNARDDLLRVVCGRLERLTRKMLNGFPNVRRWEMTDDVLQNATLRLVRCLEAIRPGTTRDFYNLAAVHVRRELLDLARHYAASARNEAVAARGNDSSDAQPEAADSSGSSPDDLERWSSFHESVERLPAEEREVVSLRFYHGWTQVEIAELFQIDERTVRRRWETALSKIRRELGDLIQG